MQFSGSNPLLEGSANPSRVNRIRVDDSKPGATVIIWELKRSRLELISRVVSECGGRPRMVEAFSAVQEVEFSVQCSAAVVALGARPPLGDLALEVIRNLKEKGFKVICYEEGAHSWPLGVQCQALLAGSSWLLDSSKSEFPHELQLLLARVLQTEAGRWEEEARIKAIFNSLGLVGESPAMISVFRWILRVSILSDLPTLLTGETGTGKELLARAIHQLDPKRRKGPFVAVNCGAISPGLVESEFFGHRRGAFTGAAQDRKGLIRFAHGGILFLDEISELDAVLQTKLLRFLQENRVLGVGEDQEVSVSVRVIAASNRDLNEMVGQGKFRADLFHRLDVLALHIPALRERAADLKPLVEHFVEKYRGLARAGSVSIGPDFVEAFTQIDLPGNARQLENLVRWALVNKNDDAPLSLSDLPREIWQRLSEKGNSALADEQQEGEGKHMRRDTPQTAQDFSTSLVGLLNAKHWNLSQCLRHCEKLLLEAALHVAHGNQSQTARMLGITPRSVYNKLRKHRLFR